MIQPKMIPKAVCYVFIIERLHVDPTENVFSRALYYEPVGVMTDELEARKLAAAAGYYTGNGWPIKAGKRQAERRVITVPILTPV